MNLQLRVFPLLGHGDIKPKTVKYKSSFPQLFCILVFIFRIAKIMLFPSELFWPAQSEFQLVLYSILVQQTQTGSIICSRSITFCSHRTFLSPFDQSGVSVSWMPDLRREEFYSSGLWLTPKTSWRPRPCDADCILLPSSLYYYCRWGHRRELVSEESRPICCVNILSVRFGGKTGKQGLTSLTHVTEGARCARPVIVCRLLDMGSAFPQGGASISSFR